MDWSIEEWREAFEERAGIMEFEGGLSREEAEAAARESLREMLPSRSEPVGQQMELTL